jgi:hypothetical protein
MPRVAKDTFALTPDELESAPAGYKAKANYGAADLKELIDAQFPDDEVAKVDCYALSEQTANSIFVDTY